PASARQVPPGLTRASARQLVLQPRADPELPGRRKPPLGARKRQRHGRPLPPSSEAPSSLPQAARKHTSAPLGPAKARIPTRKRRRFRRCPLLLTGSLRSRPPARHQTSASCSIRKRATRLEPPQVRSLSPPPPRNDQPSPTTPP